MIREKLIESEDKLIRLIDAFTFVYVVSIFTFAATIAPGEWLHSTSDAIALFYLGLLACYAILHPQALLSKFSLLYVPFLILCAASFFWTWDKARWLKVTVGLGALWVLCSLMFNYLYLEHKTEILLKAFYLGGICIAFVTIQYYGLTEYVQGVLAGKRMGHVIVNTNDMGMCSAYAGMIALYYCLYKKKWLNIFLCIFLFAVANTSLSRKVLAMSVMGVFLLVFFSGSWKRKLLAVFISLALVAAFYYLPVFEGAKSRFLQMLEVEDGSTSIRLRLIKLGLTQFKETPYFGIGLGGGRVLNGKVLNFHSYSHNNYIELLVDLGAVGCALYYFHYLFPSFTFIKQAFSKEKGMSCLMLSFILVSLMLHIGSVEYHERFTIVMVLLFYLVKSDIDREDE